MLLKFIDYAEGGPEDRRVNMDSPEDLWKVKKRKEAHSLEWKNTQILWALFLRSSFLGFGRDWSGVLRPQSAGFIRRTIH